MTPLQQKFLKAIDDNIDNIGYGDIAINYKGAAKASEQICIEEKIELLEQYIKMYQSRIIERDNPEIGGVPFPNNQKLFYETVIYDLNLEIELLQTQLNNLK